MLEVLLGVLFEVLFGVFGEAMLTIIFEPIDDLITRVINKKTKKYNKRCQILIEIIVYVVCTSLLVCYLVVVILSFAQRIDPNDSNINTAIASLFLTINMLFIASAILRIIFSRSSRIEKCILLVISTIVLLFNALFLFIT
ncbi:hypothetical protein [Enterococcus sp. AZ072]|uniref:hypothetical protein n=1 Tax=unclassified Enterococcus TaxID=2608891 RepID=UPI003D294A56